MSFYYLNPDQQNNGKVSPYEGSNSKFENFEGMPSISSRHSDGSYQCSDNVSITGNTAFVSNSANTLSECKSVCQEQGGNCIGFDFNNNNNSCTVKNSVSDISNVRNGNVMCIKRKAGSCKINVDPQTEVEQIFNSQNESMNIPGLPQQIAESTSQAEASSISETAMGPSGYSGGGSNNWNGGGGSNNWNGGGGNNNNNNNWNGGGNRHNNNRSNRGEKCKPDTIYVDLPCFLNKMESLRDHSDNLMIDLQLLITNLKSCAFIRKNRKRSSRSGGLNPSDPDDPDNNNNNNNNNSSGSVVAPIQPFVPPQDTIHLFNAPASVLYTDDPNNSRYSGMVVGSTREPFQDVASTAFQEEIRTLEKDSKTHYIPTKSQREVDHLEENYNKTYYVKIAVLVLILLIIVYK
ncbi:MAG: hypothetical protein Gaeavirus8_13 [Gaeavirus sp.]|uniref:Apple domain-containing protein n=1 Tax=Gaeavirus sp. TaxID=2487767 RepID=A0A3G4ZYX2_9VIRU|nr:MAG: hypothetical protein Gaeavirus8_13 [Gaeavirus sp.]